MTAFRDFDQFTQRSCTSGGHTRIRAGPRWARGPALKRLPLTGADGGRRCFGKWPRPAVRFTRCASEREARADNERGVGAGRWLTVVMLDAARAGESRVERRAA